MKKRPILSAAGRKALTEFVDERTLLAFDFDGTIAPIVRSPERARLSLRTASLLRRLTAKYPSACVTGRSLSAIEEKVKGVGFRGLVGNHGSEWAPPFRNYARESKLVVRWVRSLREQLASVPGIRIEEKKFSLSVHYRVVPRLERWLPIIEAALATLDGSRLVRGKKVVNVVPVGLPDKGFAVQRLMELWNCPNAVFFGDDVTDEDVFRLHDPRILGIRVGPGATEASYYLDRMSDMSALLVFFLKL